MSERSTFDSFEQRLAGELERYVAAAVDPTPAAEIAAVAMRPRTLVGRARNLSRPRRFLLLGLAAALLVPAAYIGASNLRPPAPDQANLVEPLPTDQPRSTSVPSPRGPSGSVSVFVRRDDGPGTGVSVFAVRPDGGEVLVRKVPDSIVPGRGTLGEWGAVSESGWLALGVEVNGGPWPMVLADLGNKDAAPWVIDEASLGAIGPRWGPTGLVAADTGSNGGSVVIADPEAHTTRIVSMRGGLVGGGPTIVWSADGSGIVGSASSGAYDTVPIDGSDPRPGVSGVFDPRGTYGPGLAELRLCAAGTGCQGGDDGRIERIEIDGSATTIWQKSGSDRALAASFGSRAGEYWLSVDHDNGRQVALVHLQDGRLVTVATVNRDVDWKYVDAPTEAPDGSAVAVGVVKVGDKLATILVPLGGAPPTLYRGNFVGFVDGAALAAIATGDLGTPAVAMPAAGRAYALPSIDELIAVELRLNQGRTVLGKASHDATDGDTDRRVLEVARDKPGGQLYLDCLGPSSVTVTAGDHSATSPCLSAGSNVSSIYASGPITVSASGDTAWRVVIYAP